MITNYEYFQAGEKLFIGDFVRIICGVAKRASYKDYDENEKRRMSAGNYEKDDKAIIINESTVFYI